MKLKTGIFRAMGGSEQSLCHLGEGSGQLHVWIFFKTMQN